MGLGRRLDLSKPGVWTLSQTQDDGASSNQSPNGQKKNLPQKSKTMSQEEGWRGKRRERPSLPPKVKDK